MDESHFLTGFQKEDRITSMAHGSPPFVQLIALGKVGRAFRYRIHLRLDLGNERHCAHRIVERDEVAVLDEGCARGR